MKKISIFLRDFVLITFITFIFVEILLRVSPFALSNIPSAYQPSEEFGWGLIPNTEYSQTVEGNQVVVRINNKGLRDIDHDYNKPKNTYRILFLGDSFTEAKQVNLEETFVKVLENKLNQYVEFPVEVINGGVSAFGTDNELLYYQNEGFKYQADLVFVMFFFNDVVDNTKTPYFKIQDDYPWRRNPIPRSSIRVNRILRNGYGKMLRHTVFTVLSSMHLENWENGWIKIYTTRSIK